MNMLERFTRLMGYPVKRAGIYGLKLMFLTLGDHSEPVARSCRRLRRWHYPTHPARGPYRFYKRHPNRGMRPDQLAELRVAYMKELNATYMRESRA